MNTKLDQRKCKKAFVLQQDKTDCGAACLLSLIYFYGGGGHLEKLRGNAGTSTDGTTLLGLHQAAKNSGFDSQGCRASIEDLINHGEPVILHVLIEKKLEHYIICYGYEDGLFLISDPAKGLNQVSKSELDDIWVSKNCLTLMPNEHFIKKEKINQSRKEWIFKLVKDDYLLLGISIGLGILIAALGVVMSIFSQKLIDDILPSQDSKQLILSVILVAIFLFARVCLLSLRQLLLLYQSRGFNNRIINSFYGTLLYLPKPFFDNRKIGDLVARLNDTGRIQRVVTNILGGIVIDGLTIFFSVSFIAIYSWKVSAMASISLPIYFLLVYRFNSRIIRAQKEVMGGYARSESNFISTIQGVSTIKNMGKQDFFSKLNQSIYGDFQDKSVHLGKINIRLGVFSGLFGVIFSMGILTYMSFQVFNDKLMIGEMMAVLGMLGTLFPAVSKLALVSIPINEAKVAFDRMFELVSIPIEGNFKPKKERMEFKCLRVNRVSFRFPGRKEVLQEVSFKIDKGELISIIGESGSGKSTLNQILQKFYLPEKGQILVNQVIELKEIQEGVWNSMIGVVPQDIHIFNGSFLDNICLSKTENDIAQTLDFCQKNDFDHFINSLPQGLNTVVGEGGINLSGGQKQILALLRALVHKPQLLILDEATAAMDRLTEKFVIDLLKKLKSEMAIILISHRLHLLKRISERIYILEDGRIHAFGTHDQLMSTSNFYSSYWKEISEG